MSEKMSREQMNRILGTVDHTLLAVDATEDQIRAVCDEAIRYGTASVCIPPSFVEMAAKYVDGKTAICTVIGFPNGYSTTETKCFEAADAVKRGADEIDMVINVGWVKEGRYEDVKAEINRIKDACGGRLLKVIIETCLLTEEEKIEMCSVVSESNADYIKTSTGFASGGATFDDIAMMKKHMTGGKKIKAAGGIGSPGDAEKFLQLGADRLGTSRVVKAVKAAEAENVTTL